MGQRKRSHGSSSVSKRSTLLSSPPLPSPPQRFLLFIIRSEERRTLALFTLLHLSRINDREIGFNHRRIPCIPTFDRRQVNRWITKFSPLFLIDRHRKKISPRISCDRFFSPPSLPPSIERIGNDGRVQNRRAVHHGRRAERNSQ